MIKTQQLHSADLMRALDAQPHELRTWLRLEPLASRERKRRSATAYSALDALFLAVIKQLSNAGFAPKALQTFSESIYKALQNPPSKDVPDVLPLYLDTDGIWNIGETPEGLDTLELRIPLQEIRLNLLHYIGAHLIKPQMEIALLASVEGKRSSGASVTARGRRASR